MAPSLGRPGLPLQIWPRAFLFCTQTPLPVAPCASALLFEVPLGVLAHAGRSPLSLWIWICREVLVPPEALSLLLTSRMAFQQLRARREGFGGCGDKHLLLPLPPAIVPDQGLAEHVGQ